MSDWKQGDKATWSKDGSLLTLTHVGRTCFIAEHEDYGELSGEIVDLRPIKTDAEIERERVIDKALDVLGYDKREYVADFERLVFAGLLADPEKRVKALSLSIFSKAWVNANSVDEHYESLKYLGYIQGVDNDG